MQEKGAHMTCDAPLIKYTSKERGFGAYTKKQLYTASYGTRKAARQKAGKIMLHDEMLDRGSLVCKLRALPTFEWHTMKGVLNLF